MIYNIIDFFIKEFFSTENLKIGLINRLYSRTPTHVYKHTHTCRVHSTRIIITLPYARANGNDEWFEGPI